MESIVFTLQNNGNEVHNDTVIEHPPFPFTDLDYTIRIRPLAAFWRFGIRLSEIDEVKFYHPKQRYKNPNPDFPDIHLGVGEWNNRDWSLPNRFHLAQYNFEGYPHILKRHENYVENSEIIWSFSYSKELHLLTLTYHSEGIEKFYYEIKTRKEFNYFQVFAWADKTAYKIEGTISWEERFKGPRNLRVSSVDEEESVSPGNISHAGLLSDTDAGKDLLDISKDVSAFAKIMGGKTFIPPLAIALLGEWGSGKSFFMRQLQGKIDDLSSTDKLDVYCKGIAHIRFNAWSYLDANLWASMISRIFSGLNEYISGDAAGVEQKKQIKQALTQKLSVSKEQIDNLETQKRSIKEHIKDLSRKRQDALNALNKQIDAIKKHNLLEVLSAVDTAFKVRAQITNALNNNPTFKEMDLAITALIPDEYLDDPSLAYKEVQSAYTFLKLLFNKKTWWINLLWILAVLAVFVFTPRIIAFFTDAAVAYNFTLLPVVLSGLVALRGVWDRVHATYQKVQPIAGALWKIKENYVKAREKAIHNFEQEEKAIKLEIEKFSSEITLLDRQINEAAIEIVELEYKINNTLATNTLYSFIQTKSEDDNYKKHLGIISTIRKDLEILNNLFSQHHAEAKKESSKEQFIAYFKKPLERIVLYIDDLDRCPAENVVQVLDAVNLLMAFPLFVVVVGVDSRWIMESLKSKHNFETTGVLPENYLEKIFQIPFQLKSSSDTAVKQMIADLSAPFTETLQNTATESTQRANVVFGGTTETAIATGVELIERPEETKPEELSFSAEEQAQMQIFSALLGNNPRAIKRFLNIYRVIRTHEDLKMPKAKREEGLFTVMFLIALSVGKSKNKYNEIVALIRRFVKDNFFTELPADIKLATVIDQAATEKDILALKDLLMQYVGNNADNENIKSISFASIIKYLPLVNRFTFTTVN